jgi:hypothetical protein
MILSTFHNFIFMWTFYPTLGLLSTSIFYMKDPNYMMTSHFYVFLHIQMSRIFLFEEIYLMWNQQLTTKKSKNTKWSVFELYSYILIIIRLKFYVNHFLAIDSLSPLNLNQPHNLCQQHFLPFSGIYQLEFPVEW